MKEKEKLLFFRVLEDADYDYKAALEALCDGAYLGAWARKAGIEVTEETVEAVYYSIAQKLDSSK